MFTLSIISVRIPKTSEHQENLATKVRVDQPSALSAKDSPCRILRIIIKQVE